MPDEQNLVGIISRQHRQMQRQPVGDLLDRVRQAGAGLWRTNRCWWPVIEAAVDRLIGLEADADQADDDFLINNSVDSDA